MAEVVEVDPPFRAEAVGFGHDRAEFPRRDGRADRRLAAAEDVEQVGQDVELDEVELRQASVLHMGQVSHALTEADLVERHELAERVASEDGAKPEVMPELPRRQPFERTAQSAESQCPTALFTGGQRRRHVNTNYIR